MNPAARDMLLDRREGEILRREAEYGARIAARKQVLRRWADEDLVRDAEFTRLQAGDLTDQDLAAIRTRRMHEDARRDAELASWALENEAVVARMRREDGEYAAAEAALFGVGVANGP